MKKIRQEKFDLEDEETIDNILTEGIRCCAEIEVGEAVDCLMVMFNHIQESDMVKRIKQVVGKDKEPDIDQFLICLFVSEVATLTANFKKREKKGGEA